MQWSCHQIANKATEPIYIQASTVPGCYFLTSPTTLEIVKTFQFLLSHRVVQGKTKQSKHKPISTRTNLKPSSRHTPSCSHPLPLTPATAKATNGSCSLLIHPTHSCRVLLSNISKNETPLCPLHQMLTFSIFNILLYLLPIRGFILFLQIYGVAITINNIENRFAYFEIFTKGIRQHAPFCNLNDVDTGFRGILIAICSSCSFTLTVALYPVIGIHHVF